MKLLVTFTIAAILFMVVFVNSNTLKIYTATETRSGMQYLVTKHDLSWDRFFDYLKGIPQKIKDSLPWQN